MDFQVETTVDLTHFQDGSVVRKLLQSHHFKLTELDRGQVRVEGPFQRLKDVKARLEELLETTPHSSSDPTVSSGAISKHYSRNKTDEGRGRPPDSSRFSGSSRRRSDDLSPGEQIVIDSNVYRYAKCFRKQELDNLQTWQELQPHVKEGIENTILTLQGRSSEFSKLQTLLDDLSKSLRTQEVLKRDLSSEGKELLRKIQENNHTLASVLVCEMNDSLCLIGPSKESYDLKQSLQGGPVGQSGGRGRATAPTKRSRSSSMPRMNQRSSAGREVEAAAGFSSFKDDGPGAADAGWSRHPKGQSHLEPREKQHEERLRNKALTKSVAPRNPGRFSCFFGWLFKRRKRGKKSH